MGEIENYRFPNSTEFRYKKNMHNSWRNLMEPSKIKLKFPKKIFVGVIINLIFLSKNVDPSVIKI